MGQDNASGVVVQGAYRNLSWVDRGLAERSLKQVLKGNELVLRI